MNTKNLNLSIIPLYHCNMNCDYCYLGNMKNDKTILSLKTLDEKIAELLYNGYNFSHISIYGGEISLLDKKYLDNLIYLIKKWEINVTTNLTNDWIIDYCKNNNIHINVSLNEERSNYEYVLKKIKNIDCSITSVVLPSLLEKDINSVLEFYNLLGKNVYFLEYNPSIYCNKYDISTKDFIIFLKNIITEYNKGDYCFDIENMKYLNDDEYNPTQSGFVFILPNGNYGTVEYKDSIEHLVEFESINEWEKYIVKERKDYLKNCCLCEFFDKCKAEHLKTFSKPYCSGLYDIIKNK